MFVFDAVQLEPSLDDAYIRGVWTEMFGVIDFIVWKSAWECHIILYYGILRI